MSKKITKLKISVTTSKIKIKPQKYDNRSRIQTKNFLADEETEETEPPEDFVTEEIEEPPLPPILPPPAPTVNDTGNIYIRYLTRKLVLNDSSVTGYLYYGSCDSSSSCITEGILFDYPYLFLNLVMVILNFVFIYRK